MYYNDYYIKIYIVDGKLQPLTTRICLKIIKCYALYSFRKKVIYLLTEFKAKPNYYNRTNDKVKISNEINNKFSIKTDFKIQFMNILNNKLKCD